MELKIADKVKAAVEIDNQLIVGLDNSVVFENIGDNEAFIFIKSTVDNKEIKIRFLKKTE